MPETQMTSNDTPAAGDGDTLHTWKPPVIRILPATLTEYGGAPGDADNGTFVS